MNPLRLTPTLPAPDIKVWPVIGSRYYGPHLDRSPLRQMPRLWVLEESKPLRPAWYLRPMPWLQIAGALTFLLVYAAMVRAMI